MYDLTFLDVSEFVDKPLRTGVQRVLVKALQYMPRDKIIPFKVIDEEHVGILDPAIFDMFVSYFHAQRPSSRAVLAGAQGKEISLTEEELQIKFVGNHPLAVLQAKRFFGRARRVINLESFSSPTRSKFYASCAKWERRKVFHFIHDFLVFDRPQVFPQLNWRYALDYVLLFEAYCAAGGFIVATAAMARKVSQYFNRPLADVQVVHFGGDLSPVAQSSTSYAANGKRRVVVVGTIEPRKYPLLVAQALDSLAATRSDVECLWIGNWGWVDSETRSAIAAIFGAGRVQHLTGIGDDEMAAIMQSADVGVYVSSAEGFGLPVIEFAALGIPVVSNDAVPSSELVSHEGCTVLTEVNADTLVAAIVAALSASGRRDSHYSWTWKDTAREILESGVGYAVGESAVDDLACWRSSIRLVRDLRGLDLEWEDLKKEVGRLLASDKQLARDLFRGEPKPDPSRQEYILEMMSEIVSDNRSLIHWADFMQVRPLLSNLVRSIGAENHFDGVSRAYIAFLGRLIDGRAASEAVRITDPRRSFERMIELVNSDESRVFLGDAASTALRRVLQNVGSTVSAVLATHLDLLKLMEVLNLPPPSLQEVILAEDLVRSGVDRLELLAYFIAQRPVVGDHLDLLMEQIAKLCLERGPLIHAGGRSTDSVTVDAARLPPKALNGGGHKRANGAMNGTKHLMPRSFMREVSIFSEAYFDGWYPAEYAGDNVFRWMGGTGSVSNPDKSRAVEAFVLDIQDVYGAHEPMVAVFTDEIMSPVEIVAKAGKKGWQLRVAVAGEDTRVEVVRLRALASDCPAKAEGSKDDRQLSLCITGATFTYRV